MTKKISFIPTFDKVPGVEFLEIPKPAKNYIPEWYKKEKFFAKKNSDTLDSLSEITVKGCVPFLDTLTSGYMLELHQDIIVVKENNVVKIKWRDGPAPLILRMSADEVKIFDSGIPTPIGCSDDHWAWRFYFAIKVPRGYSALITHPFNRYDLPFISSSGIIDEFTPFSGQFSFWLKEGFEGIIPKGTPIAQLFPFKRDDWKSENDKDLTGSLSFHSHEKLRTIGSGYYKKTFHRKKSYK